MAKGKSGGKSHKGRQSVAHARKYVKQFDRTSKNKLKAWKKHLKGHPMDVMARKILEPKVRGF